MDNAQLKMILDTIAGIAGTAGWVGIGWAILHYLTLMLQALAIPVALAWATVKIAAHITHSIQHKTITRNVRINDVFINEEAWNELKEIVTSVSAINSNYIHMSDVKTIKEYVKLGKEVVDRAKGSK